MIFFNRFLTALLLILGNLLFLPINQSASALISSTPESVVSGPDRSCAIYSGGALYCWGTDTKGNLGSGGSSDSVVLAPTRVKGIDSVAYVAIGTSSTCAIAGSSRELYCWGDNSNGSLGSQSNTNLRKPVKVPGLSPVRKVVISATAGTCALVSPILNVDTSGSLYCWGAGVFSPKYVGETADIVAGSNFFCKQANGWYCFSDFNSPDIAKTDEGFFRSWMDSYWLVAGAKQACARSYTPWNGFGCMGSFNRYSGLGWDQNYASRPESLTLGSNFSCLTSNMVDSSTRALCWGNNDRGQLGLGGSDSFSHTRLELVPLTGVTSLSASTFGKHTCAISSSKVYCWGSNESGQLGDGTLVDRYAPTAITATVERFDSISSPIISGNFSVGSALTAATGEWDDGVSFSYQWLRSGIVINGATDSGYVPKVEDLGESISVVVTGTKTGYAPETRVSDSSIIRPGTLTKSGAPAISGTPSVGFSLSADAGTWDTGVSLSYQWMRDGFAISSATKSTYLLEPSDAQSSISVQVTGSKLGYVSLTSKSSEVLVGKGNLARFSSPTITGTNLVGQALTASTGIWDAGVNFSYQWLRDGQVIANESSSKYLISLTDAGHEISLQIIGEKTGYESITSLSSRRLVPTAFSNLEFTGSNIVGSTVWVAPNQLHSKYTYSYQWFRNGLPLSDSATRSHRLVPADLGAQLSAEVCANLANLKIFCVSKEYGFVVTPNSFQKAWVSVRGKYKPGETLGVTLGSWAGNASVSFQWYLDDKTIPGATGNTYKVQSYEAEHYLKVAALVSREGYQSVTVFSPAKVVRSN